MAQPPWVNPFLGSSSRPPELNIRYAKLKGTISEVTSSCFPGEPPQRRGALEHPRVRASRGPRTGPALLRRPGIARNSEFASPLPRSAFRTIPDQRCTAARKSACAARIRETRARVPEKRVEARMSAKREIRGTAFPACCPRERRGLMWAATVGSTCAAPGPTTHFLGGSQSAGVPGVTGG